MKAFIRSIAGALPKKIETNAHLNAENPSWSMETVAAKSGVLSRHIVAKNETALDLAQAACAKLFKSEQFAVDQIDAIVFCTQSPDYIMPPNSHLIHKYLNLNDEVLCFDFNLACSGFIYGLAFANSFIVSGQAKNVLLITADTYSKYIHPKDRSARSLFGDGAAATLVCGDEQIKGFNRFELSSSGKFYDKFYIPAGGLRNPRTDQTCLPQTDRNGNVKSSENIQMDGMAVWSFINTVVPKQIFGHLQKQNLNVDDIQHFVFHQASKMTIDSLVKILEIPDAKVPSNLSQVGNTVSASIPLCLRDCLLKDHFKKNDLILLSGFGVGMSYGTTSFVYERQIHAY